MASNIRAQFKGVRESPLLSKPQKIDQVWDLIFGTVYKIPVCPDCGEKLYFSSMEMQSNVNLSISSNPRVIPGYHSIQIIMECRICQLTVYGMAKGLNIKRNGEFTLEKIDPYDIVRGKRDIV